MVASARREAGRYGREPMNMTNGLLCMCTQPQRLGQRHCMSENKEGREYGDHADISSDMDRRSYSDHHGHIER